MTRPGHPLIVLSLGLMLGATEARALPLESLPAMRRELAEVEADLVQAQARRLDVPAPRIATELAAARMALDTAALMQTMRDDPKLAESWLDRARAAMLGARTRIIPSRAVEARGIFLDAGALPKTPEGVRQLVGTLSRAGFNLIYPEVFRRGYTLYPSRLTEQDPEFRQSPDLLKTLVEEAKRLDMEVHPWIWTLRVRSPGMGNPVLDRLPALAARPAAESRFLSPADPRARQWVSLLVDEMFAKYAFDGLMLDYIRYDELTPEDEISRTYFALDYLGKYGQYPPSPIPPNSQAAAEWQGWREEQVNLLVKDISERLERRNPRLLISVATFRGESYARLSKMQHWRHWANNRWIDIVTSMLYTSKAEELATWLSWETDGYRRPNLLYPVLGPHRMNDAPWETLAQVRLLQQKNQPGVLFFAMSHMRPALFEALAAGPFRSKALLPHRNSALAAKRVLQELDGAYLRALITGGDFELSASARALSQEVQAISSMIPARGSATLGGGPSGTGGSNGAAGSSGAGGSSKDLPFTGNAPVISRMEQFTAMTAALVARNQLPKAIAQELSERMAYAQSLMRANAHSVTVRGFIPSTRPPVEVKVDLTEVRD